MMDLDYTGIIAEIRQDYQHWTGTHGITHWARVARNGKILCPLTGADPLVVELFALFHDSRRQVEWHDPEHGARGATFAKAIRDRYLPLSDAQFSALYVACAHHTEGREHDDITVETCWDCDRLDLARVLKFPNRKYLCTDAAPRLRWASNWRAVWRVRPRDILKRWSQ